MGIDIKKLVRIADNTEITDSFHGGWVYRGTSVQFFVEDNDALDGNLFIANGGLLKQEAYIVGRVSEILRAEHDDYQTEDKGTFYNFYDIRISNTTANNLADYLQSIDLE